MRGGSQPLLQEKIGKLEITSPLPAQIQSRGSQKKKKKKAIMEPILPVFLPVKEPHYVQIRGTLKPLKFKGSSVTKSELIQTKETELSCRSHHLSGITAF